MGNEMDIIIDAELARDYIVGDASPDEMDYLDAHPEEFITALVQAKRFAEEDLVELKATSLKKGPSYLAKYQAERLPLIKIVNDMTVKLSELKRARHEKSREKEGTLLEGIKILIDEVRGLREDLKGK